MLIIDKFAYTNNLKDLSPKKKFGYSMGLLLASLINKEPLIFIAIIRKINSCTLKFNCFNNKLNKSSSSLR